jgi:hypothetical protein
MLALADMHPCWTVWSLDKEGCKLPELPLFVKAMFANGNGGEPGEDYQKHHTNPIELWIDDLSGSPKIKVALKLIQEAFEKEEGTRRKAMIGRRPLLPRPWMGDRYSVYGNTSSRSFTSLETRRDQEVTQQFGGACRHIRSCCRESNMMTLVGCVQKQRFACAKGKI